MRWFDAEVEERVICGTCGGLVVRRDELREIRLFSVLERRTESAARDHPIRRVNGFEVISVPSGSVVLEIGQCNRCNVLNGVPVSWHEFWGSWVHCRKFCADSGRVV